MGNNIDFSEAEIQRYSRHILLKEVGAIGQVALKNARVLLVGAGGLGAPVALYLAAAGVGHIGVADEDRVELSNLQRQITHNMQSLGHLKVHSIKRAMLDINPDLDITVYPTRVTAENVESIIHSYDIICDGSDNFTTRYVLNDACYFGKKTLVSAAVLRFEGQLSLFHAHKEGPCYRCLYPYPPEKGTVPSCAEAGILGAVTGVMGTLQATEILKQIIGIGENLSGRVLIWNALTMRFQTLNLPKNPDCPLCGAQPSITSLKDIA